MDEGDRVEIWEVHCTSAPPLPRDVFRHEDNGQLNVVGKFPKLTTTLRAEVLATMLAGDDMSRVESVFASGSTKLATVMRALTRRYRWPITRREFAANTDDGRVAWVSMYTLPAEVVAVAFSVGADEWIAEVRAARSKRLAAPTRRSAPREQVKTPGDKA